MSDQEPKILKVYERQILNSEGQQVEEIELVTTLGVFRGQSTFSGKEEKLLKTTIRKYKSADYKNYRGLRVICFQNTPALSQAFSYASLMFSAAVQRQSLLSCIQRLARKEQQNIPAVIIDLAKIGPATVSIAVTASVNCADMQRQLLEFFDEQRDVLMDFCAPAPGKPHTQQQQQEEQPPVENATPAAPLLPPLSFSVQPGGVLQLKKEKGDDLQGFLEALWVKMSKTNVRFLLDMNYNQGCGPERIYTINGQQMKEDTYIPYVNKLISSCGIISIQSAFSDKNQVNCFQHVTFFDPELKNERQIIKLADLNMVQELFELIQIPERKFVIDLRGNKDAHLCPTALAVGCAFDQAFIGGAFEMHSWARLNEMRRIEESGEFICGCEEWVVM